MSVEVQILSFRFSFFSFLAMGPFFPATHVSVEHEPNRNGASFSNFALLHIPCMQEEMLILLSARLPEAFVIARCRLYDDVPTYA